MEDLSYFEILMIGAGLYFLAIVIGWIKKFNQSVAKTEKNRSLSIDSFFGEAGTFPSRKKYIRTLQPSYGVSAGLAVDESISKLCVFRISCNWLRDKYLRDLPRQKEITFRSTSKIDDLIFEFSEIPCEQIISSEVFEDGNSITATKRGSQIGGALVGGALLGGVGVIVGGLSGKKVTSNNVSRVGLRLTINDADNPLRDIFFLEFEVPSGSPMHEQAMREARYWHGIAEILIKKADTDARANLDSGNHSLESASVADEIRKLSDLRDASIISPHEFESLKQKLLGASV